MPSSGTPLSMRAILLGALGGPLAMWQGRALAPFKSLIRPGPRSSCSPCSGRSPSPCCSRAAALTRRANRAIRGPGFAGIGEGMSSLALLLLAVVLVGNTTGQLLFKARPCAPIGRKRLGLRIGRRLPLIRCSGSRSRSTSSSSSFGSRPVGRAAVARRDGGLRRHPSGHDRWPHLLRRAPDPARIAAISLIAIGVMLVGAGGGGQ